MTFQLESSINGLRSITHSWHSMRICEQSNIANQCPRSVFFLLPVEFTFYAPSPLIFSLIKSSQNYV